MMNFLRSSSMFFETYRFYKTLMPESWWSGRQVPESLRRTYNIIAYIILIFRNYCDRENLFLYFVFPLILEKPKLRIKSICYRIFCVNVRALYTRLQGSPNFGNIGWLINMTSLHDLSLTLLGSDPGL